MKDESSYSRIQEVALVEVKKELSHPVSQNLDRQRSHVIGEWSRGGSRNFSMVGL